MDLQIQTLIRKYAATLDPKDAVVLARTLLRLDTYPVKVWVCEIDDHALQETRLFYHEMEALLHAANRLKFLINDLYLSINGPLSPWVPQTLDYVVEFLSQLQTAIDTQSLPDLSRLVEDGDQRFLREESITVFRAPIH